MEVFEGNRGMACKALRIKAYQEASSTLRYRHLKLMANYSIICRFVIRLSLGGACNLCDTHGPSGKTVMAVAAGSSMNMAELEKRRLCPWYSLSFEISGKQVYCLWCGSQGAIWQDLCS